MDVFNGTFTRFVLCVVVLCCSGFLIDIDHAFEGGRPAHYLIRDSIPCALLYALLFGIIVVAFSDGWSRLSD